jgi:cytochrome c oxidase cbb3-type subunit 4
VSQKKDRHMNIDVNDLRIAATVVSLLLFVSIWAWAWARRNRAQFAEAAELPFQDVAAKPESAAGLPLPEPHKA